MAVFASPVLAIGFGAFLLCAETCLHFESIVALESWFDLPLHDWFAGSLLLYAGLKSRRDWTTGRLYQIGGWAFNVSLFWGAFVAYLEDSLLGVPEKGWIPESLLLVIIGLMFAVSVCGLVSTTRHASRSTILTPGGAARD